MSAEALIVKIAGYVVVGLIVVLVRRTKYTHWLRRVAAFLGMTLVLSFALGFAVAGGPIAIAICLALLLLALGGPMATYIATPAGLPRVATTLATLGAVPYHVDKRGIGSIAAARTCLVIRNRRQKLPADELARLDQRLAGVTVLRPGTVAARAFACVALGDRELARILFKSVGDFAAALRTGPTQAFAARWLVADAASQGDWSALRALPRRLDTPLTRFAAACATRIEDGPSAISGYALTAKWLRASPRLATRPLLRMALASAEPPRAVSQGPLLARHVAALKSDASASTLIALADAWNDVLHELAPEARASVMASLAAMADANPAVRGRHPLFAGATDLMRDFELALSSLERRIGDGRTLALLDEWVELARVRDLYEQLTPDAAYRRLAYDAVRHLITNYAADLFNKRKQKPMANALFMWMEREARVAQDEELLKLNTKNVACGYG